MSATSSKNMTRTWLTNLEENSLTLKSEKCTFKKNKWLMAILLYELGIGPTEEKVLASGGKPSYFSLGGKNFLGLAEFSFRFNLDFATIAEA